MTFLKYRLEEIASHKLDILPINEFIKLLCASSSQSTKERTTAFLIKWENGEYQKNLTLAFISGSWTPLSSGAQDLRFQRPWDEYLRQNFSSSLNSTSIGQASAGFKPFNFKDLVQMPFWKELYENFGHKSVSFIFEKCLIVSEIEENFFLAIGAENCTLSQKLSKTVSRKRKASVINLNTCASMNPYQLEKNVPNNLGIGLRDRKRRRYASENVSEENDNKLIIETGSQARTASENSHGIIRWLIPSEKILKFMIEEREKLKASYGIPSVCHAIPIGISEINYVGIMQDDIFLNISEQNINLIIKQSCLITFPKLNTPSQWEGLKFSQSLLNSNTSAYVNVFKISETYARKNNVRVKPKQRRKTQLNSSELAHCSRSKKKSEELEEDPLSMNQQPSHDQLSFGMAFDPFIFLGTLPMLYNKSSWSRWPRSHILTTACNNTSKEKAARLLLNNILNTDVGASINFQISECLSSSETKDLSSILEEVVSFHGRVKDLHRLVKSCLTFWMVKKQAKLEKQEQRKLQKAQIKLFKTKLQKLKISKKSSIEMIDLTADTPSTSSHTPEFIPNHSLTEISVNSACNETKRDYLNSTDLKLSEKSSKQQRRAFAYARLKEKVPHTCLMMAIKQILHVSKIEKLLGSKKNIRGFFSFLRKSVILAGTKSSLQFGQLMALLDPNDCQWLNRVNNSIFKYTMLAKVSKWLFTNYIMVILKTSFYITEVSESRLHASFYLRESWKSISEHVKHRFTQSGTLRHVGRISSRKVQLKRGSDGVTARVRFIPKKNFDVRPILSLNRESYRAYDVRKWTMLINHLVRRLSPHRLRDTNVIRQKWLEFLQYWNKMHRPKLYFVRGDIKDAYPSVDMEKLKDILLNASKNLGVLVSKDFRVVSSSRVVYRQTLLDESSRELWNASIFIRPCIVQETNRKDNKFQAEDVAKQIASSFKQNIVRLGNHKFSFEYGLPQGWKLSEGLCNIYYGNMDSEHFSGFLNKKGEFLITSVDDYLYITPDPQRASKFYRKMLTGIPDYGCKMNETKMFSNIYPCSDVACCEQECEWVNFCGWKFCLTCGHLMRDFLSYKGQDMASTLSFNPRNISSPENFLISRMKIMLPARLHYFLLDPAINCRERIIMNIYEAGFIFAFRFYAICRVVFPSLNAIKDPRRAVYIVSSIYNCTKILSQMVANTFRHTYPAKPGPSGCKKEGNNFCCPCMKSYIKNDCDWKVAQKAKEVFKYSWMDEPVEEAEIFYVVYQAFVLKLKKHSQVFKDDILPKLYKMRHYQKSLLSKQKCEFLTNLLGNSMPKTFEDINI